MTRLLALGLLGSVLWAAPAGAHHVGSYTARDNEISANFKQLKFSMLAGKYDVALRLFEEGAVRQAMRAQAATLPPGLEETTRSALQAGDARAAEWGLTLVFAALIRDLAREAERQVGDPAAPAEARRAAGRKFLEAIWRYYNLVDFAMTQRQNTSAVAIRLAFDEAETYAKGGAAAAAPEKMREPLGRIARILSTVLEGSSPSTRRAS